MKKLDAPIQSAAPRQLNLLFDAGRTAVLDLRQSTLSQQLARLRDDELVDTKRDDKQIYYSLSNEKVRRTINTSRRHVLLWRDGGCRSVKATWEGA